MAQSPIRTKKQTPLKSKYDALPRGVNIKKSLEEHGISNSTFARDLKRSGSSIEYARLQIYAGLFDCEVSDLIDSFTKPKALVRKSIGKRLGLKSS